MEETAGARLLQPWEVLDMAILDMKVPSQGATGTYLSWPTVRPRFARRSFYRRKEAVGVSRKLLDLLLVFGLPL